MIFDQVQSWIYEAYAPLLGEAIASLMSGFAIVIDDRLFLTPAGCRYVDRFDARAA